jgi:uncharacterized repeat protein (TIGR03803 family)
MRLLPFPAFAALTTGALCCVAPALAQNERVISPFGYDHGRYPQARLLADNAGNLYGAAELAGGGVDALGSVFELVRHGNRWSNTTLYRFSLLQGGFPEAGLIAHRNTLFGTTALGGEYGCGMVFALTLHRGLWKETTLHGFSGSDGCVPVGELARDSSGNLYGSTGIGGAKSKGTIFELTPSGVSWTYQMLYSFAGADGYNPQGIRLGADGTIFGTTGEGGSLNAGIVFALAHKGGAWKETVLHSFGSARDGSGPSGGLAKDSAGNLYGSTTAGGAHDAGTVYELTASGKSWTETVLYSFTGGADGNEPIDGIELHKGVLYGATASGGSAGGGTVFTLTQSGNTWAETVLHSFPLPGGEDGSEPAAHPIVDESGAIYGTTLYGGKNGYGRAYRIIQ